MFVTLFTYFYIILISMHAINTLQNTLDSAEIKLMDISNSYPSNGACSGVYSIDTSVSDAVITSNVNSGNTNYDDSTLCVWKIQTKKGARAQIKFQYFFTECFWDKLTIFDSSNTNGNVLANLCGNRDVKYGYSDIVNSTGSFMTLVFQSDSLVNAKGFRAFYSQIDGPVENVENYTYEHRFLHSSAYDAISDIVFISFGLSTSYHPLDDLILYFPKNDTYQKRNKWPIFPGPRYRHHSWILDSNLILYGGVSNEPSSVLFAGELDTNNIWSYNYSVNSWTKLPFLGQSPPTLDGSASTLAIRNNSGYIYVYGGKASSIQGASIKRTLYVYSLAQGIWKQLSNGPVGIWGGSLVYQPSTDFLHLVGGFRDTMNPNILTAYPSYKYSIASDAWFTSSVEDPSSERVFATVQYLKDDFALLYGGIEIAFDPSRIQDNCFHSEAKIFDMACETWSILNTSESTMHRMGHSMSIREQQVFIFGGFDGFFYSSQFTFSVSNMIIPNDTTRDKCKANKWCKPFSNCHDCMQRKMCSWCESSCVIDTQLYPLKSDIANTTSVCAANQTFERDETKCPLAIILSLGLLKTITMNSNVSKVYLEVYIDTPDQDILFQISNVSPSATLALSFPGLGVDPIIKDDNTVAVSSTDIDRIGGNYLIQVSLNSPLTVPLSFNFLVTLNAPDWVEQKASRWGQIDVSSFAIIFAVSILISFLMTLIIHRARQRLARMQNHTLYQASNASPQFDVPKLYQVRLTVPNTEPGFLKFGLFKKITSSHKDLYESHPEAGSTEPDLQKQKSMSHWKLSVPNFIRGFTSSLSTLDIFHHRDQWPISVERIPEIPDYQTLPILAISYIVLQPGYEKSFLEGDLNHISIATVLYKEQGVKRDPSTASGSERSVRRKFSFFTKFWKR